MEGWAGKQPLMPDHHQFRINKNACRLYGLRAFGYSGAFREPLKCMMPTCTLMPYMVCLGLRHTHYGDSINSHDVVVRLNVAPVDGYKKFVGSKTTFRYVLW